MEYPFRRELCAELLGWDKAEFERLTGVYPQQRVQGGEQLAMDGKTLRGARDGDEEPADHVLNMYDVQEPYVMVQAAVGRNGLPWPLTRVWLSSSPLIRDFEKAMPHPITRYRFLVKLLSIILSCLCSQACRSSFFYTGVNLYES